MCSSFYSASVSPEEVCLVECVARGEWTNFSREPKGQIQAALLRHLIRGGPFREVPAFKAFRAPGLRIRHATFIGKFDLAQFAIPGSGLPPLIFEECDFPDGIDLEGAYIARLWLKKCRFPKLILRSAVIDGPLNVTGVHNDSKECWIDARDCFVNGDLTASGARLRSPVDEGRSSRMATPAPGPPDNNALSLTTSDIRGAIRLDKGFQAHGGVSVASTKVRGTIWAAGAVISAAEAVGRDQPRAAFHGQHAEIDGSLVFDGANVTGPIWLVAARIGGTLQAPKLRARPKMRNKVAGGMDTADGPPDKSLVASNARIGTQVDLSNARLRGEVTFESARIGGECNCSASVIRTTLRDGLAFRASGAEIGRNVCFDRSLVLGQLDLTGATVGGKATFVEAFIANWTGDARGKALSLSNTSIGEDIHLGEDAHLSRRIDGRISIFGVRGQVDLTGANIGGDLRIEAGCIDNPLPPGEPPVRLEDKAALRGERMRVDGSVRLSGQFACYGEFNLSATAIGRDFECTSVSFKNPPRSAIYAKDLRVGCDVCFSDSEAQGDVRLERLDATGSLRWQPQPQRSGGAGLTISSSEKDSVRLDLRHARLGTALKAKDLRLSGKVIIDLRAAWAGSVEGFWPQGWRGVAPGGSAATLSRARGTTSSTGADWPCKRSRRSGACVVINLNGFRYDRWATETLAERRRKDDKALAECATAWLATFDKRERFKPHPYRHLASVLRSQGEEIAARRVAVKERDQTKKVWWVKPFWRLFGLLFGYGYRPGRALIALAAYIVLGAAGVGKARDSLVETHTIAATSARAGPNPRLAEAYLFSSSNEGLSEIRCTDVSETWSDWAIYATDMILPFIPLHQETKCEITPETEGNWWRLIKASYTIVGWIVASLTLLTLSGVVRRFESPGTE